MKIFLSSVSLAALTLCFMFQASSAMELDTEKPTGGMKRLLEANPVIEEKNPATPSKDDKPYSNAQLGDTDTPIESILIPLIIPHLSKNKKWEFRLVSKDWNKIANHYITELNLCPRFYTPEGMKNLLLNSTGPEEFPTHPNYQKDLKSIIYINGTFFGRTPEGELPILKHQDIDWWTRDNAYFKFKTKTSWNKKEIPNPFQKHPCYMVMNLENFPNLEKLWLENNIRIGDKLLKKATNLKELELGREAMITPESLMCLKNLTHLTLGCNKFDYSDCLKLPHLESLTFRQEHVDTDCSSWEAETGNVEDILQQQVYITESLFSIIDSDEDKQKFLEYQTLRDEYVKQVWVPNFFNAHVTKLKSKWSYDVTKLSFTEEDLRWLLGMQKDKIEYSKTNDQVVDYYSMVRKPSHTIEKIINALIEKSGKKLTIRWEFHQA